MPKRRTPTAVLRLRGSWRAKAREAVEPTPPPGDPIPPAWLKPEAAEIWKRIVPLLRKMNVLASTDGEAIARYCAMLVQFQKLQDFVDTNPMMYPIKDDSGRVKSFQIFPQWSGWLRLSQTLLKIEREFGLTPSARASLYASNKIAVPLTGAADDEGDEQNDYMKFRGGAGAQSA